MSAGTKVCGIFPFHTMLIGYRRYYVHLDFLNAIIAVLNGIVVTYLVVFFGLNFWFVLISASRVRRLLHREVFRPPDTDDGNEFFPPLTLLVPAYNEEVTCIESVNSLLKLRYPSYEVIICNDGSKDATVDVLRKEFAFERADINYRPQLETAEILGLYEARCALPPNVKRLLLIDKANGGKADALNAAINASQGIFVSSMDADSVLEPTALLRAMQVLADNPNEIVAVGTQVGLSNGSVIEDGEVLELRLPQKWIARFQVAEYMRSFTQGRTALAKLNSLLILSGVFALMRRDLVVEIGGFLTKHIRSKVVGEYCGVGAHTVCEDMEVILRMHRYMLDKKRPYRIAFLPHPTAWTEAPEVYEDLGKQRGRWYRGLLEVLWYHRAMFFRARYKQIGWFSLPYQFFFEAMAPIVETAGYILVPLAIFAGLLSVEHSIAFILLATALNTVLSTASVLVSIYGQSANSTENAVLFGYPKASDALLLLVSGFFANFGYRQYLVWYQLKGLRDFLKGRKDWDKFARKGFAGTT